MDTVSYSDLYIGYQFHVYGIMRDSTLKLLPSERLSWSTVGTIEVQNGIVTKMGCVGDKIIVKVYNRFGIPALTEEIEVTND